ncbi:MAG: Undecaprenyl-phosphate glucose phosphotransferase [Parcubacteria group bacterium GW2011_GWD2_38_12]|nr:MAG: Undecaprenyl-phosphate glucose phosphotransferase [Parcubacteria group bacterium GW2011_GWD2_38_12]
MKRSEIIFKIVLVPMDFFMLAVAAFAVYFLRLSPFVTQYRPVMFDIPPSQFLLIVLAISPFWILIFALAGLYRLKPKGYLEEFFHIISASTLSIFGILLYLFLRREWFDSRFLIFAIWPSAIMFLTLGRIFIGRLKKYLISHYNIGIQKILIVGKDKTTELMLKEIYHYPNLGYRLVHHLRELDFQEISRFIEQQGVEALWICGEDYTKDQLLEAAEFCEENRLVFRFVPNLFQTLTANIDIETLAGVPLIELKRTPLEGWNKVIKRMVDFIGAIFGIILFSPVFILSAILIKLDSRGPVIVRLKRISLGKEFYLYKFRSMVENAHEIKSQLLKYNEREGAGPLFKMKNDPRITRVGGYLRKFRMDELPQFFNVLKGDMSMVGPRPHEPEEIAKYQKHHKKLLTIKAGITGMAQVSGSSDLPFEDEVKLDTYYIENWSLFLDFKILLKTVFILFTDRSAC